MVWTAATMNTFIRDNLGPQLKKDGLSTQIYIFDHNKGPASSDATQWAQAMFGDATTKSFVAGSAVHWYGSTFNVYEDGLDALHAVDATKDILFDEGTADGFIFNSTVAQVKTAPWFQNDDWYWKKDDYDWGYVYADKLVHPPYHPVNRYARDIIVGLNHWYTGWIDWNAVLNKYGALDAKGGGVGTVGSPGISHIENGVPAGIMIDEANPAAPVIYYTPIFYVMRHFSKFIRPGAKVMTTTVTLAAGVTKTDYDNAPTQDGQALLAVGAQNPDGSTATVLFNETNKPIDFSVVIGSQTADGTIPAQALQTLVFK
jgi:glucosylceramidase